jgi:hypothetical protein
MMNSKKIWAFMRKITIKWNQISSMPVSESQRTKMYLVMQDNVIKHIGNNVQLTTNWNEQGYSVWEGSLVAESLELTERLINRVHHLLEIVNKPETTNSSNEQTEGMVINIENIGCNYLVRNIGALA